MIYADDKQIFCFGLPAGPQALLDNTNNDVSAIAAWAEENGIKLNSSKTSAMLCGSQFYISSLKDSTPPLFVDGAQLQTRPELTILGLKLTPSLSWGTQVSRVCISVHHTLYALRYYRHALSRSLRKRLIKSMIFATFDYGSSVFYDMNQSESLKLHRLHNACVRFVYGTIPHRAHVTPYRLALGWLSAQRRRDYNIIVLAINVITRQSSKPLANLFKFQANQLLHRAARRQPPCYKAA
uniref:Reverse transcriptase domain-containing protein n=1 Tax=Trichogramma kaykai TaxID=54128 RepID=A0ABD2W8X2_9HYME